MDYSEVILAYFAEDDVPPLSTADLGDVLRVKKTHWSRFKATVEQLVEAGKLRRKTDGRLQRKRPQVILTGVVRRTAGGAGSVRLSPVTESGDEAAATALAELDPAEPIHIEAEHLGGALTGDIVEFVLSRRRRTGGQRIGRITKIVQRAKTRFVGTYHEQRGQGYVTIDGAALGSKVAVGDPGAKGARPNDKVVVEILRFPEHDADLAEGVLTQVLGPHGQPGVDCLSIIHEFSLPDEFGDEVLEAARETVRAFNEHDLAGRLDLTNDVIVTIDPVDARDFDDAISLEQDDRGHWKLGVHIADVSHFVPEGSPLDRAARHRGTSVYLPDRVLPMLPELISNGLASLQAGHVRYTKTVFIHFDPEGLPTGSEFASSAIRVTRRFAYEEVMPILAEPDAHRSTVAPEILALLQRMHTLAMLLRRRRFARGALDLRLPEVKIDFDADGRVTGAHRRHHDESHEIIEEFMLAANIAVATQLWREGYPYLHRVHASPDERRLRALGDFVKGLGYDVKPWLGRLELQKLLTAVRGLPAEQAISYALLRSLKQAEYSPAEIEHFALAETHYCHFTSPIRRYPDLTIHRLFEASLARRSKSKVPPFDALQQLGEHCSMTERRAEAAERELVKVKLLTYLKDKIGLRLTATITGVERFGFFCLGEELPADGLVHVRNLPEDQYDYDKTTHTLTGRKRGTTFQLGQTVTVEVAQVDFAKRTLDFRLVPPTSRPRPAPTKKHPRQR